MPGSSTTPGRPGTRAHAPVRIAFHRRNSVDTRDMNLCEAQWLAYVLPYRRFADDLAVGNARLGADVDRYSLITSDLHRLLVAGLPAHCERFCTLPRCPLCPRERPIAALPRNDAMGHKRHFALQKNGPIRSSCQAIDRP
jgi:hypothetical protein